MHHGSWSNTEPATLKNEARRHSVLDKDLNGEVNLIASESKLGVWRILFSGEGIDQISATAAYSMCSIHLQKIVTPVDGKRCVGHTNDGGVDGAVVAAFESTRST